MGPSSISCPSRSSPRNRSIRVGRSPSCTTWASATAAATADAHAAHLRFTDRLLDKKVKAHGGKLKLSNIRPEIYEVFAITKLNKLFDIKDDEADALASF